MDQFKRINSILEDIEILIDDSEFEITDPKCSGLYHDAVKELGELDAHFGRPLEALGMPMGKEERKLNQLEKRFKRLCRSIETPEEFIQGERDAMFPNGEDEDEW